MNITQKETSLPQMQRAERSVSAPLVDTSGVPLAASAPSVDDDAQSFVIAAPPQASLSNSISPSNEDHSTTNNNTLNAPTHIPAVVEEPNTSRTSNCENYKSDKDTPSSVVEVTKRVGVDAREGDNEDEQRLSEDEDESEYEYEDDDDAAFTGFLVTNNSYGTSASTNNAASSVPIVEEENTTGAAEASSSSAASAQVVERASEAPAPRKRWREPSRAAVSMSLRAQQETSGSKRRLAQDLYRIMNQDTEEAGFSLAPQSEDSMEKWTIKLFQFDPDSNLAKDMLVVGIDHIELEMKFPDQYPFEPPFVRVVKPRFKRQTGFVMNGALCMELLTKDGWNPINDIESVIVSIRSLLVVGDGRLQAASELTKARYDALLANAQDEKRASTVSNEAGEPGSKKARTEDDKKKSAFPKSAVGSYSATEAQSAYSHLSDYHKKKGWDTSGWWARKG